MQLTEQFHIPDEHHEACDRLTTLVQQHTQRLLDTEYWTDTHLDAISDHTGQSYTYIRDDDSDAFEDVEEYVYSRFKRCVYHRVTHILDAHTDEYQAFQFVTDTVAERKIRRIGWHRLRQRLFDENSPYINWRVLESVVEQLNTYYDQHGHFPEKYTELVETPEPNGTLPYAPDKGDYHIHELAVEDDELRLVLNAPDSLSPESYHDWTNHELRFPTHSRVNEMLEAGDVKAPTLHASEHGYTLDVPVSVPEQETETVADRVLAVDLGVKKQATAVVLDTGDETHEQVTPPQFIDHPAKDKLFRVKADAEGINDRLAELRRQGKAHTERFDHLLCEYRQTRRKERRLREQIQHDVANQLVWAAAENGCETIVFESLGQFDADDTSGAVAWSISSWARGELLDHVEYKAGLLGIEFATVNPWGTSRYCPRCGERGETVNAPNDHTECRHGGHFHCPGCGYECDRDVVGAVNVGRKHIDACKMETANPAEYISTGNHASFPSRHAGCARSAGVQSATDQQDQASGRQTRLSQHRARSLTVKPGEGDMGGLHRNRGSNTGQRRPRRSVTQSVLASTTDCG
ncbi:Transposable element, IS605 OrfB family [Halalkaliarchaeum sp. AArc-CO]|uniref:RNA-guided endonuclease InsQ/TnpB family protein n=1 Tax=Halalkaliarchaeum sp. AArc-CO TaxID=2866381 RepID=UPI00217F1858|nr:transposase [Halalkaliarchaeum sp. AArc-CO]UWG52028.1 Transposable element, IS605 OrfB family [Halalkaliarchaeum sp. AArc-CO]